MTSYDREETFGLYFAVLKKGEPSPLLPESDEDAGVGSAAPGVQAAAAVDEERSRQAAARAAAAEGDRRSERRAGAARAACAGHRPDRRSTGLQQRIISVPGVPERQYSQLKAGAAGTVYYLEAAARRRPRRSRRRRHAASLSHQRPARGALRLRCRRVRRQRRRSQAALSHGRRCRRARAWAAPAAPAVSTSFSSTRIAIRRQPVRAGSTSRSACISSRARSSSRSSARAGATSATISTCRTRTDRTGRR